MIRLVEQGKHANMSRWPGEQGRLDPGSELQGRYRVLGLLSQGGMSVVYKAQDLRFSKVTRLCVVKEMLNTATDAETKAAIRQSFEREANILAALSHPGIVQIYDYFSEGDCSYLVLEHVDGRDLEHVVAETGGFLPESEVVRWAMDICDVLIYLHSRQPSPVVFRDLKPSNIVLEPSGRIRLVDFGIAKVFRSGSRGTMIGTEGYSPPEQYGGVTDPRVDVYALGATMHHLLTKQDPRLQPPFSFQERPVRAVNSLVSPELEEVLGTALQYEIEDRFASAEQMLLALSRLPSSHRRTGRLVGERGGGETQLVAPVWAFETSDEVRSSPVVASGRAFVGSYDKCLYALGAEDGSLLWSYVTEGGIASSPCVFEDQVLFGSSDKLLYAVHRDTGRLRWTCPTRGSVWSSPKVAFGHVFFGSDDRHLYAANVHGGRVAWAFETDGAVRSSPAIGDDVVYVGCEAGGLYAVDISGQLRWRFRARRGFTASPAISGGRLFAGCRDGFVYALDVGLGVGIWRYRTDGPVVSSPVVAGNAVVFGSVDGRVYAVEASNGRKAWAFQTQGQVTSSPEFAAGRVYVGSVDGALYCLESDSGALVWRFETGGPITSSPAVYGSTVYVGSDDKRIYALPA
jgi:outer membrane protein assembly factor BamB/tRNA A-37 threonylcarbamoyl transferase component Bud32